AQNTNISTRITTTYNNGGSGFEDLTMGILPKTTVPAATTAPALDAKESPGEYTGEALDIGRQWEPGSGRVCSDAGGAGFDCGDTPGATIDSHGATYRKITPPGEKPCFFFPLPRH